MIETDAQLSLQEKSQDRKPTPKKVRPFSEFPYSAKSRMPRAKFNPWAGRYDYDFCRFDGTQYKIVIPFRGFSTIDKADKELDRLTVDTLQVEGMHKFYRHVYMLQHIGDPKFVAKFIPTILYRSKKMKQTDFWK